MAEVSGQPVGLVHSGPDREGVEALALHANEDEVMNEVAKLDDGFGQIGSLKTGGTLAPLVPGTMDDAYRQAKLICMAGMAPHSLDTPEKVCVAIMHGLEIGVTPLMAVQSIAVVNGHPTLYGDGALGLVRASGLMEWIKEHEDGTSKDNPVAICEVKRKGEPDPIVRKFSQEDAKQARLSTKKGPWQDYPARMRQMRARSFALRDGFADVFKGLRIREEVEDYNVIDGVPPQQLVAPPPEQIEAAKPELIAPAPEQQTETPDDKSDPGDITASLDRRQKKDEPEAETTEERGEGMPADFDFDKFVEDITGQLSGTTAIQGLTEAWQAEVGWKIDDGWFAAGAVVMLENIYDDNEKRLKKDG